MAYVNVKDWSVDQVTDWLKGKKYASVFIVSIIFWIAGLDSVILQYNTSFLNNGVSGHQLLNLRADDLEHLGVKMLGHQEIILEAVEHLRNFVSTILRAQLYLSGYISEFYSTMNWIKKIYKLWP